MALPSFAESDVLISYPAKQFNTNPISYWYQTDWTAGWNEAKKTQFMFLCSFSENSVQWLENRGNCSTPVMIFFGENMSIPYGTNLSDITASQTDYPDLFKQLFPSGVLKLAYCTSWQTNMTGLQDVIYLNSDGKTYGSSGIHEFIDVIWHEKNDSTRLYVDASVISIIENLNKNYRLGRFDFYQIPNVRYLLKDAVYKNMPISNVNPAPLELRPGYNTTINKAGGDNNVKYVAVKFVNYMLKTINDGTFERTDCVNYFKYSDKKIDWTLTASGQYNFNLDLNAKSVFYNTPDHKAVTNIKAKYGENGQVIDIASINGEFEYNTSFMDLLQILSPTDFNIIKKMKNPEQATPLDIYLIFNATSGEDVSTQLYVRIPYTGDITEYGIYDPDGIDDRSTITVVQKSKKDDEYDNPDDVSDTITSTTAYSGLNLLSTTYLVERQMLRNINEWLWSTTFFEDIRLLNNSPIENIVACKLLPVTVSGTQQAITLGNVTSNYTGVVVPNEPELNIGNLNVTGVYGSFLDYAPYTKLTIFLPFIGFKDIDTNVFMGKTLTVKYLFSVIDGSCKAQLFADGVYECSFDGSCGIDVAVTSSNRAQQSLEFASGAVNGVLQSASGDIWGGMGSILGSAISPFHTTSSGKYSGNLGAMEDRTVFLIYDRPMWQDLTAFNHTKGRCCNLSLTIGNLTGFTQTDDNIDLSGISATQEEKDMIKNILSTGFFA